MALSRRAVAIAGLLLCGTVIQSVAGIGADQPFTAVDLPSADAPPTGNGIDLVLADDWGTVSIDPRFVISVEPIEAFVHMFTIREEHLDNIYNTFRVFYETTTDVQITLT